MNPRNPRRAGSLAVSAVLAAVWYFMVTTAGASTFGADISTLAVFLVLLVISIGGERYLR